MNKAHSLTLAGALDITYLLSSGGAKSILILYAIA